MFFAAQLLTLSISIWRLVVEDFFIQCWGMGTQNFLNIQPEMLLVWMRLWLRGYQHLITWDFIIRHIFTGRLIRLSLSPSTKFYCYYLVLSFAQSSRFYCQWAVAMHKDNIAVVQSWGKKLAMKISKRYLKYQKPINQPTCDHPLWHFITQHFITQQFISRYFITWQLIMEIESLDI